jgi:hypothetical protein
MKKTAVVAVSAMVAAMSLGIAAPASAECPSGVPTPSTNTVSLENGQVRINPSGPSEDIANAEDYANDGVACGWGTVPEPVRCRLASDPWTWLGGNYVYQDSSTGEYVVDYGQLADDADDCL